MAIDLETLQTTLRLQSDQFRAGVAAAKQDIAGLKTTLADFGKRTTNIGKTLTARVTAPIVAGGVFAIKQAADLGEAQSAVGTVYGDTAKDILGYNKSVAASTGLSREEALSAATTFGVFGKKAGLAGNDLTGFSNDTVQAAADLASFYNAPVPEALAAIQSGLSGETEPLRKFGIFLSEATVQEYALTNGIWDGVGAMTEEQKVMARSGYILDNLGDAKGDYARTSDGLTNTLRTLGAQLKDVAAQFGVILLPLVLKLANAAGRLMERFAGLSTRTKTIIVVVLGIAAALGPLLIIIGQVAIGLSALAPAFALLLGPIGLLILAIGLLTAAYLTNFLGFRDLVDNVMGSKALKRFLKSIEKIVDGVVDIGKALKKGDFGDAFDGLKKAAAGIGDFMAAPAKAVGEFIRGIKTGFRPLDMVFRELGNVIVGFGRLIQEVFQGDFRGELDVARRLGENFVQFLANLFRLGWEGIALGIEAIPWGAVFATLTNAVLTLGSALIAAGADLIGGLLAGASGFLTGTVLPWLGGIGAAALTAVGELLTWLVGKGGDLLQGLWDGITERWTSVTTWLGEIGTKALNAVADLASTLVEKGKGLINGLKQGIDTAWFGVSLWLSTFGSGVQNLVGDLLTTLVQKGKDLLQGLMDGILQGWEMAEFWFSTLSWFIPQTVGDLLTALLQKGVDLLQGLMDGIAQKWPEIDTWLANLATDAFETVGSLASTLLDRGIELLQGLLDGITNKWPEIDTWLLGLPQDIIDTVGDLASTLFGAGQALMTGLKEGITSKAGEVADAALGAAQDAINAVKGLLGIDSPSKVFMEIGHNTGLGLALGIEDMLRPVALAGSRLAGAAIVPPTMASVGGLPAAGRLPVAGMPGGAGGRFGGDIYFYGPVYVRANTPDELMDALRAHDVGEARP